MIQNILKEKNMSIYKLSKTSGIPYSTCNEIVNGKAQLEKCSAETVYKLAHALDRSMEELISPYLIKRSSFENFKSTVCHRVKELGDIDFIISTLESGDIRIYHERKWYPESFYLLAMLDYISRLNDVPLCDEYDDLRKLKLEKPVYPLGLIALSSASQSDSELKKAWESAIPEFKHFNIVENEVRNVI